MWLLLFIVIFGVLFYHRASLMVWTIAIGLSLFFFSYFSHAFIITKIIDWLLYFAIFTPLQVKQLRQQWISKPALNIYRKLMPYMSNTEREALDSGTIGFEGDLFTGMPNWASLLTIPAPTLTAEEQSFLEHEVEELCSMIDEWEITFTRRDLPEKMWQFIKQKGFFALIIPKRYGGKEFSAYAHSQVLIKIASRSLVVASSVSVPNSLGPAELLLHYGTDEQKNHYLPRLAAGEETPCFALTSPDAGSDAANMPDHAIICKGHFQGKEMIGMRLTWDKRYITLAPVATVLGLAFKLYDPEHLIGNEEDLGITCALIPTTTQGVMIGDRHFPLDSPFQNGPTHGKDVFVPLDWIIGGINMAGKGWRMLMECLSAGRAISLPSTVTGSAKAGIYATGAYARIRKQFGVSIGHFEGIQEVLARMAYNLTVMDALRSFTATAIDSGQRPAVASAIAKAHTTERARKIGLDAMDIHGGKGICLGPNNYLGRTYQAAPISITVEGANLLTRCLIIFGQGAMRCHPFIYKEFLAAQHPDEHERLYQFDAALFGHIGFTLSNVVRSLWLSLTGGRAVISPRRGTVGRYFQLLQRYSAAFALLSDTCVMSLGAELKRKEIMSGRLGDVLSYLYSLACVLKKYIDDGAPTADSPLLHFTCQELIYSIQDSINEILYNFPIRSLRWVLHCCIFPFGKRAHRPNDHLARKVAELLTMPCETRSRLTNGLSLATDQHNFLMKLDAVMQCIIACEPLEKRLTLAHKEHRIKGHTPLELVDSALKARLISETEAKQLIETIELRAQIIAVDHFAPGELAHQTTAEKKPVTTIDPVATSMGVK